MNDTLKIGDREFKSRLFVGTGKFPSPEIMLEAIKASESEMITVAMKRVNLMNEATDDMLTHITVKMCSCCQTLPGCAMHRKLSWRHK